MKTKGGLLACAVSLLGACFSSAQATVVIGTYSFENNQLVDQVNSISGGNGFYDGTNLIDPSDVSPNGITDKDPVSAGATFISTLPYIPGVSPDPDVGAPGYNGVTIDLGFGSSRTVNETGSDLALFFLFDQAGSNIDVTINGTTNTISSFAIVEDAGGTQQTANNVDWGGGKLNNVLLTVAELELTNFGLASGATIDSLAITMTQAEVPDPRKVAALSLVGSLNTAVVPVPAAVWLFGSGLIGLVGVARRKK